MKKTRMPLHECKTDHPMPVDNLNEQAWFAVRPNRRVRRSAKYSAVEQGDVTHRDPMKVVLKISPRSTCSNRLGHKLGYRNSGVVIEAA